MKKGPVNKDDAFYTGDQGIVCGVNDDRPEIINWNGNWAFACDFPGNDLLNVPSSGEKCGGLCQKIVGCTHFTWNYQQGGTCFMKKGPVNKDDAFYTGDQGIVCGINDVYFK
jgi:hypothetical protein